MGAFATVEHPTVFPIDTLMCNSIPQLFIKHSPSFTWLVHHPPDWHNLSTSYNRYKKMMVKYPSISEKEVHSWQSSQQHSFSVPPSPHDVHHQSLWFVVRFVSKLAQSCGWGSLLDKAYLLSSKLPQGSCRSGLPTSVQVREASPLRSSEIIWVIIILIQ